MFHLSYIERKLMSFVHGNILVNSINNTSRVFIHIKKCSYTELTHRVNKLDSVKDTSRYPVYNKMLRLCT